jgi:hypothetical protein
MISIAGCCFGALLANPFFLADPFRIAKSLIGTTQFKEAGRVGFIGAFSAMAEVFPFWLPLGAILACTLLWRAGQKLLVLAVVASSLLVLVCLAGLQERAARYCVPLGTVFMFLSLLVSLPRLANVMNQKSVTIAGLAVMAGGVWSLYSGHYQVLQAANIWRSEWLASTATAEYLQKHADQTFVLDFNLWNPPVLAVVSDGSRGELAEFLEEKRVGQVGVCEELSRFPISHKSAQALGNLFDETDVSLAARLRAMAAIPSKGPRALIFHQGMTKAGSRLVPYSPRDLPKMLESRRVDAVLCRDRNPSELGHFQYHLLNDTGLPVYLVRMPSE